SFRPPTGPVARHRRWPAAGGTEKAAAMKTPSRRVEREGALSIVTGCSWPGATPRVSSPRTVVRLTPERRHRHRPLAPQGQHAQGDHKEHRGGERGRREEPD